MDACCQTKKRELESLRSKHESALRFVLVINALMVIVEGVAGIVANSSALLADSLNMFGGASMYAMTLFSLRADKKHGAVFLIRGIVMLILGIGVAASIAWKVRFPIIPSATLVSVVALVALYANTLCFALLYRHRDDDVNLRWSWRCSRNDMFANLAVLIAALTANLSQNVWPDVVAGSLTTLLFLHSAVHSLLTASKRNDSADGK